MPLLEVSPVVVTGAQGALYIMQGNNPAVQVPLTKAELKESAASESVSGSTSVGADNKIWDEQGEGKSSWTLDWEAVWRTDANLTPPNLRRGGTYLCRLYTRRPGWLNQQDVGAYYEGNVFISDKSLTFDPNSGKWDWKVTGKGSGYLSSNGQ